MLPVKLIVYNDTEESKSYEDIKKTFKVVLDREQSIRRQIQILLYQTYVFKTLDVLLLSKIEADPLESPDDSKRYTLYYGDTDL